MNKAVFFDRDGTLIEDTHYLSDPKDIKVIDGAYEAVRKLKEAGFLIFVVTNQSGIGRGYYTEEEYLRVDSRLRQMFGVRLADITKSVYCPHTPHDNCFCRKPKDGLVKPLIEKYEIDAKQSWTVGDKVLDILLSDNIGTKGILVRTGHGREEESFAKTAYSIADNVYEASKIILGEQS